MASAFILACMHAYCSHAFVFFFGKVYSYLLLNQKKKIAETKGVGPKPTCKGRVMSQNFYVATFII